MKRLTEILKSARHMEWLLMIALVCVLLMMVLNGGVQQDDHQRMERILSQIEGAGRVSVLISGEDEIHGAVVLAEGADDIGVMLALQKSLGTLTGLPLDRIEVIKSE